MKSSSYSPDSVRPRNGWCSVLLDQRQTILGSLVLPASETSAEKLSVAGATIVRTGNDVPGTVVQKGDRVIVRAYLKWANPIDTDEKWSDGTAKQYAIISMNDVLAVVAKDVDLMPYTRRIKGG